MNVRRGGQRDNIHGKLGLVDMKALRGKHELVY
jgi:hypothetical protein